SPPPPFTPSFPLPDPFPSPPDPFLMSKGHGCMIQYVILEEAGVLSRRDLDDYCKPNGRLGCHPDYGNPDGSRACRWACNSRPDRGGSARRLPPESRIGSCSHGPWTLKKGRGGMEKGRGGEKRG